ncbi:CPBP family intramembrane glutamic endopeptidase [Kribbella sp. NPDC055071]
MKALRPVIRFLIGFSVLYVVLAALAEFDSSGRYGVVILAVVLLTAVVVERVLGGAGPGGVLQRVGLGRPDAKTMALASGVAVLLLVVYPIVTAATGAAFALKPGWLWLLVGVFAFHGLAEELVWRGYAFRRLRDGRSFRAAVLATMPLVAATHIPVIVSSGVTVGVAAMLVAAVTSLPLAHLYELGRGTVWAAALVHTAIDSFKIVAIPDDARLTFSLVLAGVSIVVPLLALVVRRPSNPSGRQELAAAYPIAPFRRRS